MKNCGLWQEFKYIADGLSAKCRGYQSYDKFRSKDKHRAEARCIYAQTDEWKITGSMAKKKYRDSNHGKASDHAANSGTKATAND